jgi:hypothetical protein
MTKEPKRLRDRNQFAKKIVDLATMDEEELKALRERQSRANQAGAPPRDPE